MPSKETFKILARLLLITPLIWSTQIIAKDEKAPPPEKKEPKPKKKIVSVFEDKNLENAVRRQVFSKRDNQAPLTAADVAQISSVEGPKMGIRSLKGLEHCKALASLELPGNAITDLSPIDGLPRLQLLDLSDNKITDASPLKNLHKLQYLNLENNQLTDVAPLADLPTLRSLYLTSNQTYRYCSVS